MNGAFREHPVTRHPASFLILSEVGLGLRSSFFDGAGVVVLVARQCCTACESLLAVRIRTLVGSLPGVDPAMPS
jgi:hypothetical protein